MSFGDFHVAFILDLRFCANGLLALQWLLVGLKCGFELNVFIVVCFMVLVLLLVVVVMVLVSFFCFCFCSCAMMLWWWLLFVWG